MAYFLTGGLLVLADGTDVLADVLGRLGGKHNDSLSTVSPYQAVSKRLATAAGELKPDVRWYIDPLGVAEYRAENNEKRQKNVKILRNEGFAAIQGVGGYVNLDVGDYEILHRTAVTRPSLSRRRWACSIFPTPARSRRPIGCHATWSASPA